ncbi:MAG: hypothetical protein IJW99_02665, partial [Clostridia bacterium]|nr:hypothetical protein [Clostridia bacterium]
MQKGSLDPPKNLKRWDWGETAGVKLSGNCKLGFVGEFEDCKLVYEGVGILFRHKPFGSGGPLSLQKQR